MRSRHLAIIALLLIPASALAQTADTPGRIVLGPTAVIAPRGRVGWSATDVLFHQISVAVHRHVEVELQTLLPVLYVGAFPRLKVGAAFGAWHLGAQVHGGIFWPYHEPEALEGIFSARLALYGGGPMLTYAGSRLTVSLGAPLYGVRLGQKEHRFTFRGSEPVKLSRVVFADHFVALPGLGLSVRVGKSWRLDLETHLPLSPSLEENGKLWLVMYGFGVLLRQVRLDLHFLIPATEAAADLLRILPLGIPLLTTSFLW